PPRVCTSLVSSTTTMKRAAQAATNFSMTWAPPAPLMRFPAGSTSSAPSIARSTRSTSMGSWMGIPQALARSRVWYEVGTPVMERRPWRTRSPSSVMTWAEVEPEPSPMMVLVGIRSTAATAAAFLRVSTCAPVLHKAFHLRPLVHLAQDISRREESSVLEVFLVANDDDAIHKLGEITQLIDHL